MKTTNHLLWADLLKIFSIYAVVIIHSAAPLLQKFDTLELNTWWIGNLYDSITRWCIPVFIMLSGAFLIEKVSDSTIASFFKKRIQKVLFPFIVWSVLYFFWRIYFNKEDLSFDKFFKTLISGPVYYHLWFIYVIIGLYLLTPLIGYFVKTTDRHFLLLYAPGWIMIGSIIPMFLSWHIQNINLLFINMCSFLTYTGFFLFGYLLRTVNLKRLHTVMFTAFFLISFAITAIGTYYLNFKKSSNSFNGFFYEYYSLNVILMSISLYVVAKSIKMPAFFVSIESRYHLISSVASCVPGIYFIHAMLIGVAKRGLIGVIITETTYNPVFGVPFFAFIIFVISFLIIVIIKQIPVVKMIVP